MSLYAPPETRWCEVFSEIPESLKLYDAPSEWIDANKPGQSVPSFLEGPVFDAEGNLFVTDIPHGRILRVTPEGQWSCIAHYDGWPNGMRFGPDGRLWIADYRHGILALSPQGGQPEPILTHVGSERFKGVNDLFFDQRGRLYFTDQGQTGLQDPTGRAYRYDLDTRRLDCLINNGISPNGLVCDLAEKALFVAMTRGNGVWRIPLKDQGPAGKVGMFVQLAGGVSGADGLALDEAGNLFVCDAGNGCVWVFDPHGEPLWRLRSPTKGRTLTNLAFGGPDRRMLYMTESATGAIIRIEVDNPGKKLRY
ncbi:SMP-30/gluconolactonase/LRE family protein [Halomonas sp. McH1-25]|uniref:SMP-30/gluconolactonase/LRE family protein n=1 Tax=unclassified Halomonas TaxID=2609666 RepID=UPI001EF5995E|nr:MULTISPECIES: SMP-30/gluconolactonase/LRE family protein [unclassified Halomonas]MCG7601518.1 SMP-30/gluconolactonase/LRE family protein [Halomonas sp. McH1-25]MCP1343931.1 SMP-30/gluconolactonase/LRE family protein [Halomonas sp. FL8]MCP1361534.1 SMP-30/gluconolactonase/LRE family protein [Halomonas sp. BBD45]